MGLQRVGHNRASKEASTVNDILNDPGADLSSVAALMANDTYEYLVVNNADREAALDDAMKRTGPVWIDCVMDKDEKVLPMIPPGATVDSLVMH